MNEGKLLAEEVARRAKELYEREIGSNLEPRSRMRRVLPHRRHKPSIMRPPLKLRSPHWASLRAC